jgi:hypothetical protein
MFYEKTIHSELEYVDEFILPSKEAVEPLRVPKF